MLGLPVLSNRCLADRCFDTDVFSRKVCKKVDGCFSLGVDRRDLRRVLCAIPRGAPTLQSSHKRKQPSKRGSLVFGNHFVHDIASLIYLTISSTLIVLLHCPCNES